VLELFLHEGREGLVNPTSGGGASEGVAVLTDLGCQDCVRGKGAWHRRYSQPLLGTGVEKEDWCARSCGWHKTGN
jgi:hypothetical protein